MRSRSETPDIVSGSQLGSTGFLGVACLSWSFSLLWLWFVWLTTSIFEVLKKVFPERLLLDQFLGWVGVVQQEQFMLQRGHLQGTPPCLFRTVTILWLVNNQRRSSSVCFWIRFQKIAASLLLLHCPLIPVTSYFPLASRLPLIVSFSHNLAVSPIMKSFFFSWMIPFLSRGNSVIQKILQRLLKPLFNRIIIWLFLFQTTSFYLKVKNHRTNSMTQLVKCALTRYTWQPVWCPEPTWKKGRVDSTSTIMHSQTNKYKQTKIKK